MNMPSFLSKTLSLSLGKIHFAPSYLQAGVIVFLLFILVLTVAQVRRHLFEYSLKGALFGLFFGFLLALILEGFLIIGGKTAVTEVLGWQNPPKPILSALDVGRGKLIDVLGITDEISISVAQEKPSWNDVIEAFQKLDPAQVKKAKDIICRP
jgi:hypothetical protein